MSLQIIRQSWPFDFAQGKLTNLVKKGDSWEMKKTKAESLQDSC